MSTTTTTAELTRRLNDPLSKPWKLTLENGSTVRSTSRWGIVAVSTPNPAPKAHPNVALLTYDHAREILLGEVR